MQQAGAERSRSVRAILYRVVTAHGMIVTVLPSNRQAQECRNSYREVSPLVELGIEPLPATFPGERFRLEFVLWPPGRSPAHLLDIPDGLEGAGDCGQPKEFSSRSKALRAATRTNAAEVADRRGGLPEAWAVVLEVGDPIELPSLTATTLWGVIGVAETALFHPVRIIWPTKTELKRYGVPGAD